MALHFLLTFQCANPAQHPEALYRETPITLASCASWITFPMLVDLRLLSWLCQPTTVTF
jgi:hypothetical protein